MLQRSLKTLAFILIANISLAQNFLNGSFENNTAGVDRINQNNAAFNGFMPNVNSYGTTPNLDIIRSATWGGGGAQHCTWYVALTGSATDAFNMTLSAPLVTGTTYTISFWDRKDGAWNGFPIQIGVSTNNNSIGTIVYTAPVGATTNVWTQRTFTFVAPNNGQYISVIQNAGTTSTWVHVDNFVMNNQVSSGGLNIAASATTICAGSSAVFTVTGASTYTWNPSATLSSASASVVTATPPVTTTYSVTGNAGGCILTGSITLNVIPPPAVTVTPVTSGICPGQSATLTATGASSYTWTPAATLNTSTGSVVIASPLAATNYTVVGGAGSCTSSAVASVTMSPGPILTASNQTICAGSAATCTVTGASTYTWQPGNVNGSSMTVSPLATTIYTVSGTNVSGCVSTITMQVVVNPMPVPNANSNSPVCLNFPLNLTANAATSYTWSGPNSFSSNLQNPTIPSATGINAGVYTVTVSALGCSSVGSVTVVVTTPTTSASSTSPYCAGSTISLSTNPATTYTWSGPGGFSSNSQNATQANSTPAMSGIYTVQISIGTCTASATTSVTVNALPTPTATANSPVCVGQSINFNGSGGTTYTWTGPATFNSNSATPSIASATNANGGNYVLTVSDANGCTNTASVTVVVNSNPVIVVNNPAVCVNDPINLASNGGVTYAWSGPSAFTSNVQNPNIPNSTTGMSGPYTVTVTTAQGCTNTAVSNVTVFPVPTPSITSNSPVCAGQTLNLFGSGGANYAWSGPGYTGLIQNPTINNVTAAANGVYTLLVSSGTCTASTTFTVVINPVPVFNFSGSNVTCFGQSNGTSTVNVTVGTGPFNYNWSTIPAQTTQDASNLAAGTYTCVVTDANNCSSVGSTQITEPTQFTVSINSATTEACANTPINVNAVGAGGTGPYNFNWVSGPSNANYPVNETNAGSYNYVVNATDAFNCPASANINLTFHPQPTVTATSATVCSGQTTNLTASGANTYVWQPGNVTGATYPFSGNTSINVTVVGTANGCSNSATAAVMVNPMPNASISLGNATGCVPACITFSAGGSSAITSYGWMLNGAGITGSVNGAYCFDEAASYTLGLTVMDAFGCTSTVVPVNIEIYPQPVADFNHSPLKPIINQDPFVTFTDASYGAPIVSWNWYFMNTAQYTSVQQNPTFPYTEPGTYPVALVVKSDRGCTDTLVRPIVVGEDFGIYVPNAFTPNGDGLNDIFQPKGFGVVKYELNIYDRWGERVFSTTDFEQGWNGTMNSKNDVKYGIIEEGVYTWLINATSVFGKSHELKGHVTLIR